MKKIWSLLLICGLISTWIPAINEPVVFAETGELTEDTFEGLTPGPLSLVNAPGWSWSTSVVNVNVVNESGNQYAEVSNKTTTGNNILTRTLDAPLSGKVTIEFKARVSDDEYHQIPIITGTGASSSEVNAVLVYASGGQLTVNNDTAHRTPFTAGVWHSFQLILDTDLDTVDVYRNGTALAVGTSLLNPVSDITKLKLKVKPNLNSTLQFDDIRAYPYEEPVIQHFFLRAGSFADHLGTWKISSYSGGGFDNVIMAGKTDLQPGSTEPAAASIRVETPGTYRVWARSRDFSANQPGSRYFNVKIGDFNEVFGQHHLNSFAWEDGGTVELAAGEIDVELLDTSAFYARVDAVFITNDLNLVPPENYADMLEIADIYMPEYNQPFADRLEYPEWARTVTVADSVYTLENDKVRVSFYEVNENGRTIIQKSTEVKYNDAWVQVEGRSDEFGYLLMYTDQSEIENYYFYGSPAWEHTVQYEGDEIVIHTADIFKSGIPSWIIPSSVEYGEEDNTILIEGENEYGSLSVKWSLDESDLEPLAELSMEAKKEGNYSIGIFNGKETPLHDVDYLLAPLLFVSKYLPPVSALVTEVTSTNASSIMALEDDNDVLNGAKIAYGVTVDPSSIPFRWAYTDNQKFGMGIRGRNGGVQPHLFAPILGMEDSRFTVGQQYEIAYRPTVTMDGWYSNYSHVVNDIFKVEDVRTNYYASVTDAVFNLQDLVMNDEYSGWSDRAKGFANMEHRNDFKQPSPLVMLQNYLLTEDRDYYVNRAIPTLAYLLTRYREGFSIPESTREVIEIGSPTVLYGSGIAAGMYHMTRGLTPAYRQIGITDPLRGSQTGQIPLWLDKLNRYKFTGNPQWLALAKSDADNYIDSKVYGGRYNDPNAGFYALDGYPYFSALLDLYETTNEQKYLDAAVESARQLLTSTWTQPMIKDEQLYIDADWIRDRGFWSDSISGTYFWNGDTRQRLGNQAPYPDGYTGPNGPADNISVLESVYTPSWLTSRIGWSVEGTSSFFAHDALNVPMTNWAGELVRLAHYTGDSLFETTARNGIIGRAANYPGYYIGKNMTHYMQENYPYTGPDTTGIYYHQIPVYLGMLQDFLISQAWSWSDGQIEFPSMRQYGYVWFDNRVYGHESGQFFGEEDMWLWLKRGLLEVDNRQIDWIAARKDGTFAAALMNEETEEVTASITLGDEITGGTAFNVTAAVYDESGQSTAVPVVDGVLEVTVPAKKLIGIVIQSEFVEAPAFAGVDLQETLAAEGAGTTAELADSEDFGKGYVLQIDPDSYFTYVFIPDTPDTASRAILHYELGDGVPRTKEVDQFPFEFITEVEDVNSTFTYTVEKFDNLGNSQVSASKILYPVNGTPPGVQ